MSYLVISSDGHAGPPPEVYREYLDDRFRTAFDEHQAELEAGRMVNTDFVEEWDEETGDHEMQAGYDPASATPSSTSEGVAAEVLFPDADVLGTGRLASSPFGSGLGSGVGADPDAGPGRAPGPTTAGSPTSAPPTRTAASAWPSCPSPPASTTPSPRCTRRPSAGCGA